MTKTAETKTPPAKKTTAKKVAPAALFNEPAPDDSTPPPRTIGGKTIVAEEPVPSPLPRRDSHGAPLTFKSFSHVTFDDGTQAYACRDCDHTTSQRGTMLNHRQNDHPKPAAKVVRRTATKLHTTPPDHTTLDIHNTVLNMTLREVIDACALYDAATESALALQTENEKLRAEIGAAHALLAEAERRQEKNTNWRERAATAENEVRKIQAALARVGFVLKVDD